MKDNQNNSAVYLLNQLDPLLHPELTGCRGQINKQLRMVIESPGFDPNVWVFKNYPEPLSYMNVKVPAFFAALAHGDQETAKIFWELPTLDRVPYGTRQINDHVISAFAYFGMNAHRRDEIDSIYPNPATIDLFSMLGSDARLTPDNLRTAEAFSTDGSEGIGFGTPLDLRNVMFWVKNGSVYPPAIEDMLTLRDLHIVRPHGALLMEALRAAIPQSMDDAIDFENGHDFSDHLAKSVDLLSRYLRGPAEDQLQAITPANPLIPFDADRFDRTREIAEKTGIADEGRLVKDDGQYPYTAPAMFRLGKEIMYRLATRLAEEKKDVIDNPSTLYHVCYRSLSPLASQIRKTTTPVVVAP